MPFHQLRSFSYSDPSSLNNVSYFLDHTALSQVLSLPCGICTILSSGVCFKLVYTTQDLCSKQGLKQPGEQPKVKADIDWYVSNAQNTYNSGVNDRP